MSNTDNEIGIEIGLTNPIEKTHFDELHETYTQAAILLSLKEQSVLFDNIKNKNKKSHLINVYCKCSGGYDNRPMIECEFCKEWYHLSCINMSTEEANTCSVYCCDNCKILQGCFDK